MNGFAARLIYILESKHVKGVQVDVALKSFDLILTTLVKYISKIEGRWRRPPISRLGTGIS